MPSPECVESVVARQVSRSHVERRTGGEGGTHGNLRTPGDNFNSLSLSLYLSPETISSSQPGAPRRERGDLRFLKLLTRFFDFNYSFNIF